MAKCHKAFQQSFFILKTSLKLRAPLAEGLRPCCFSITNISKSDAVTKNLFIYSAASSALLLASTAAQAQISIGTNPFALSESPIAQLTIQDDGLNNFFVIRKDVDGDDGNAASENMLVFDKNGKLGLGTSAPTEVLDVVGNMNASGYLTASDAALTGSLVAGTATAGTVSATTRLNLGGTATTDYYIDVGTIMNFANNDGLVALPDQDIIDTEIQSETVSTNVMRFGREAGADVNSYVFGHNTSGNGDNAATILQIGTPGQIGTSAIYFNSGDTGTVYFIEGQGHARIVRYNSENTNNWPQNNLLLIENRTTADLLDSAPIHIKADGLITLESRPDVGLIFTGYGHNLQAPETQPDSLFDAEYDHPVIGKQGNKTSHLLGVDHTGQVHELRFKGTYHEVDTSDPDRYGYLDMSDGNLVEEDMVFFESRRHTMINHRMEFLGQDDKVITLYGAPGTKLGVNLPVGDAPTDTLDIDGSANISEFLKLEGYSDFSTTAFMAPCDTTYKNLIIGNNDIYVYTNPTNTSCSDARIKEDIADLDYGLEFVRGLQPKTFRFTHEDKNVKKTIGFIAQDILALESDAESDYKKQKESLLVGLNEKDQMFTVNYPYFGPIAIAAIKEVDQENQKLKADLASLRAELEALKAMVQGMQH